jgi:hypothetical protein
VARTLGFDVNTRKTLFAAAAFWEILRFAAIFFLFSLQPIVLVDPVGLFNLLWFGSTQLVLAAGFTLVALYPGKYGLYVNLLRLGKLLAVATAVLVILLGGFTYGPRISSAPAIGFAELLVPPAVFLVDLILFVFLLTYRGAEEE